MQKAFIAVSAFLLAAAFAHGEIIKGKESAAPSAWFKDKTYLTELSCKFGEFAVGCTLSRPDGADAKELWRFGSDIGRFTASFLSLSPEGGGRLREPRNAWMAAKDDGTTLAEMEIPVVRNGREEGSLKLKMAELKSVPGWIFFKIYGSGGVGLTSFSIAARLPPSSMAMGGTSSTRLFMAWPGGSCGSGEMPPWNGRKPDFNALSFFVRGKDEGMKSDFIVFNPDSVKSLSLQRWDGVAILLFGVNGSNEHVFAIGCKTGEPAEETAAPAFLDGGSKKIIEAMGNLSWASPNANKAKIDKLISEIAGLLKDYPDLEAQGEFDKLAEAAKSLKPDDMPSAIRLEEDLKKLAEDIANGALKEGK